MSSANRLTVANFVTAALSVGFAAGVAADEPKGFFQTAIYEKLARSTARVENGSASGTAWVVDHKQKLLVTNFHVVAVKTQGTNDKYTRVASRVKLIFPKFVGGAVDQSPNSFRYSGKSISAEIVGTSMRSDLALLKADSLPEDAAALKLAAQKPKPGSRVHSVGHPAGSNAWWVYSSGTVRAISRFRDKSQFGETNFSAVETQSPLNHGDSGGAMVNDQGEVIAVVQGRDQAATLMSFAIESSEIRMLLSNHVNPTRNNDADANYKRAGVLFDRQEYSSSIAELDKAIAKSPDVAVYHFLRGHAHLELSQYSAAISDVQRGLTKKHKPIVSDSNASDSSKTLLQLLNKLQEGKTANASYGYTVLGETYLRRGDDRNSQNDYQQALQAFDQAISAGSSKATVYYNRGYAKEQLGRNVDALADYVSCIKRNPRHSKAWCGRGGVLLGLKRFTEALTVLNQAVRLTPNDASIRIQRGNAHYRLRDYNSALQDYTNAKRLSAPNSKTYRNAVYNIKLITG